MKFRSLAFAAIGRRQRALLKFIQPPARPADNPAGRQMMEEFGFIPAPVLMHDCVEGLFAGSWMLLREIMLTGSVSRVEKERLSTVISSANQCPFCVQSHGMALSALGSGTKESAAELRTYSPEESVEITGTKVLFHYLNRVVNVFLLESPLAPVMRLRFWRRAWLRIGAWTFAPLAAKRLAPGESLPFLPEAPLPPDLSWAEPQPNIAGAFARFADALGKAAQTLLPNRVRELIEQHAASPPAIPDEDAAGWLNSATSGLSVHERPLGILALLGAFASWRVTTRHIEAARAEGADDAVLLTAVARAAFAVAKIFGTAP